MIFIAHTSDDARTQPLADHVFAVANRVAEECALFGLEKVGSIVGILHDCGKANRRWQEYIREPIGKAKLNHSSAGARYVWEHESGEKGVGHALLRQIAALSICGHHAGLYDIVDIDGTDILLSKIVPEADVHYEQTIMDFLKYVIPDSFDMEELFQDAACELDAYFDKLQKVFTANLSAEKQEVNAEVFFALGLTVRNIQSALIDADRYDTFLFCSDKADDGFSPDWKLIQANVQEYYSKLILNARPATSKGRRINELRTLLATECVAYPYERSGIYRLYIPTGGGKTVTVGIISVSLCVRNAHRRIFYIAPFKTVIEQNAAVFRDMVGCDEYILEHHGDVVWDDDESEEYETYKLLSERWECPVVITTLVQLLNTLFAGKSSSVRRFHSLCNSVIIFDEVQSVPAKCIEMFNTAVNYLSSMCGCTVILCTATQPEFAECAAPMFPAKTVVGNISSVFTEFKRTEICDLTAERQFDAPELAQLAIQQVEKWGSCLVIVNTRSAAKKLFAAVKKTGVIEAFFLSTDLCPAHRTKTINIIKQKLKSGDRFICVSTQLIEAGVDISFPVVIRTLAGLDSVAQSAGRCNRNGENETNGKVIIVRYSQENLSHLEDIRKGSEACAQVLNDFSRAPDALGEDLLSPPAISRYYKYFFHKLDEYSGNTLAYPLPADMRPRGITLYGLLSLNIGAIRAARDAGIGHYCFYQAFRTAGRLFRAIDEKPGVDAIVPYGEEGKRLINEILMGNEINNLPSLLRKAQVYSVHVYDHMKTKLSEQGAIHHVERFGVYFIDERFYSDELGVTDEPMPMENLIQ